MKRLILASAVLLAGMTQGAGTHGVSLFAEDDLFQTGCNYWASHAGMYMWRRWDAKAVEKDVAELSRNGVTVMRVFPLWPDFQPLTRLLGGGGSDRGVAQNDGPLQNEAGVDEEMMRRFRFLCDVAAKNDVRLVVGLITGWMSGRMFVPPAFEGKGLVTDPEVVAWQVRFVRHFVREMKGHPAIVGWDLGNECNCMANGETSAYASWLWMNAIASAIRLEDASRPVVSGMHSCSTRAEDRWNLAFQGELMDELTTHPYPLFTPECARDRFDDMRSETHPTAESLLYWGLSGRHCFVEEAGDLGRCTGSPERSAANVRCAMATAWANGLGAYVWWCGFDQQHLDFPPYTWNAVERELGLFTKDYEPKPVLLEMGGFRRFLAGLPGEVARLPARRVDATVLVSNRERAWASAFGAYLLSRQAGFDIRFANAEKFPLPDSPLYILPSGNGCDPYTYEAWCAVLEKAKAGATLLISKGNDTRYSGVLAATGNEIDSFCRRPRSFSFRMKGSDKTIAGYDSSTTVITPKGSEVLGATHDGAAVVTSFAYGKGKVLFCNFPIESDSVCRSDCFSGHSVNPRYLVYCAAARAADIRRTVEKTDAPNVGLTEHALSDGRLVVVAVNYDDFARKCPISVNGRIGRVFRGKVSADAIDFAANDFAVFEVLK